MSEEQVKDPETMSYEELQALANGEMQGGEQVQEPAETSTEGVQTEEPVNQPETVFRHEIDLGDGSGKQVFEAPTLEELVEKLGEAQKHATIKIRELAAAKKTEQPAAKEMTADEEWLVAQELATNPSKAFDKILQSRTGMTAQELKDLKARVENMDAAEKSRSQEKAEYDASLQFREAHPDYVVNETNGKKMIQWLKLNQLPGTVENITKAYEDLKQSGLLALQDSQTQGAEATGKSRIVTVGAHTRKVASGLSTRRSVSAPRARTAEPTEEDLYKMPYDQLEKLANGQA